MSGLHIAFFNYPAHGHVNPTLPVAAELVRRGHRVTYVVAGQFAEAVAATGADVLTYESVVPKAWNTVAIPQKVTADDIAEASVTHLTEALAPLDKVAAQLDGDRPDVMVYDAFGYATGRLLARKWRLPSVLCATTIAVSEKCNPYAEFAASMTPPDPEHPALVKHRELLRGTLDAHGLGDWSNEEFTGAAEERTLCFVAPEFQPGVETFDERTVFVGPCIGDRAHQGGWQRPDDDRPVALVALGSFGYENQAAFYRDALAALGDLPWHIVMSLGGLVTPDDLGPLPPNVETHPWVPQPAVLRHASSFVSHAGMGSTMESLSFGVPPVVVPRTGEQDVVAGRLTELGLGRAIAPDELTAEGLRAAVLGLAADEEARGRVRELSASIAARRGPALAADTVEARCAAS
ncbi:macrolide family glycosyltransferase [Streptomyces albus]|uniref:MGT family glycosyltransferase n=1 Tax=Streptomyces albus TaxID=1888 RepID=A0A8H1QJE5_9ACTN|nr:MULTISPECIES: macrolide family glycosyltransferase [Streptomyces]TGG74632.1 MGT family glycosyltransferase [Streptomyces albus]UVN58299.1 MGT family glycosyltransferase [Streptomyces albus]